MAPTNPDIKSVPDYPENQIPAQTTEAAVPDPFALDNLRLNQSFTETAGIVKLLRTVPVRKPNKQDYCRVNPSPEFRDNFPTIELKDDNEEYIVTARLVPELIGECTGKTLYTAIN